MAVDASKRKPRETGEAGLDILSVVGSRVAMFVVLFWTALTFDKDSLARGLVLIYGLSTVLYLATWVSAYRAAQISPVGLLLFFQFLVEVLVEAAVFYSNDGYLSDYGLLFILTILSAGFFFRYLGSLTIAATATALFGYAGLAHLGITGSAEFVLPRLLVETVQVRFLLYATLFFMVALLSSLLSGRLHAARRELAGKDEEMDLYQFSAETVMDGLPTGLLFFDADGLLKFKNHITEEWLGRILTPGMPMREVLQDTIPVSVVEDIEARKENFRFREIDAEARGNRPLHIQIKSVTRETEYLGCVLLLIDFTEEKRMARALLRAERMATLGAMSARIAHEIRNPLASISGSAQMLRDTEFNTESDRKLLGLIVTESTRLNRILSGLLDYARDRQPAYREVSVVDIFKKITLMLEKITGFNKDLAIVKQIVENGDIRFKSDQDILVQVLLNLALNSFQSLPGGKGILELSGRRVGDNVLLTIKDNGVGMSQVESARAFEPFFTTKPAGSGLGLPTCLHYVQALEGNIILKSQTSEGTSVIITLPAEPRGSLTRNNGH